jgi:hypothetical protein
LHVGIGTISNLREKSAERVHIWRKSNNSQAFENMFDSAYERKTLIKEKCLC